jgi:hypothetical protein
LVFPAALLAQSTKNSVPSKGVRVPSGEDRFGDHILGVSSTDFKVSTQDSGGGLLIMSIRVGRRAARRAICTTRRMSGSTLSKENTSLRSGLNVSGCNPAIPFSGRDRCLTCGHLLETPPATAHRLRVSQQDGLIFSTNPSDSRRYVFKSEQCAAGPIDARIWELVAPPLALG